MSQTPEEVALERIQQAAESGAEFLDLTLLGLTALLPEIGQLNRIAAINHLLSTSKSCGFKSRLQPTSTP